MFRTTLQSLTAFLVAVAALGLGGARAGGAGDGGFAGVAEQEVARRASMTGMADAKIIEARGLAAEGKVAEALDMLAEARASLPESPLTIPTRAAARDAFAVIGTREAGGSPEKRATTRPGLCWPGFWTRQWHRITNRRAPCGSIWMILIVIPRRIHRRWPNAGTRCWLACATARTCCRLPATMKRSRLMAVCWPSTPTTRRPNRAWKPASGPRKNTPPQPASTRVPKCWPRSPPAGSPPIPSGMACSPPKRWSRQVAAKTSKRGTGKTRWPAR